MKNSLIFILNLKTKPFGKDLTLKNLAQMESGLDWDENYKNPFLPNARAYYGKNLLKAAFSRRFKSSREKDLNIKRLDTIAGICPKEGS